MEAWHQREDVWVPPGHFYSPIASFSELKVDEEEIFEVPPAIRGVDLNEGGQLAFLKELAAFYPEQPFTAEAVPGRRYLFENPNYSYNDAIILYCIMRQARPRRIVEIGSGYSSCAMLDVNELFFDNSIACTFIDPYTQLLRQLIKPADQERIRILDQRIQHVDVGVFRELTSSDILFVDSSHIAKTGSDVNYILFKILPLLEAGVLIHFHDVFYPFEYPKEWVFEGRSWNESYLLRAFLQYNDAFEIVFFNSFLAERHRRIFQSAMPLCFKVEGANLWLRKKRHDPKLDRPAARMHRRPRLIPKDVRPGKLEYASCLKEGWYGPEFEHCWMNQSAALQIGGPASAGERLVIRAATPLDNTRLIAAADGLALGSVIFPSAGQISGEFQLPDALVGREVLTVTLAVDRIYNAPGDPRPLGLAVSRLQVR
jgi:predicted O-methyltransferase YrrM